MDWIWFVSLLIHLSSNTFGIVANSLLIYLVAKKTSEQLITYSTLIFNFAICDLFACTATLLVQPRIIALNVGLYFVFYGPCKIFGSFVCFVGHAWVMHCYGHTLFSLVVSFAYRYYVLVHEKPKRFTIIFIVITVYLPSFLAFILFCFGTDSEDQVKLVIHSNIGYDLSSECVRGHVNILKWETLIPVLYIVLPVVPIYTAILILKSMTVSKLVVTRGMSQYTRTLHTQLLRALIVQACLPVCFLLAVVTYGISQLNIYHHPSLEHSISFMFGALPILSPLTSLYFIRPYRIWIRRKLWRNFCASSTSSNLTTIYHWSVLRSIQQ